MAKKNKRPELDKWQKEIERLSFFEENAVNKKLFKYYRQALIDIKKDMKEFMDNYEKLSFSKRLEAERLLQNGKQIDKILRDMNKEVNNTIEKHVKGAAERGYYGSWYALEGITGLNLDMNMLPEKYIKELVNRPVKGQRFSSRLYKHRNQLAKETTGALLDAARTGKSYAVAAGRINELTEASYKKALRIARTEGGRVQSTTKQRSYVEAKKKGVDIQKQWMSTIDGRTRHSHQSLDGQIVEVEEKFESEDGYEADGPRLFGIAKEDVHCRCTTITVVKGVSPELRANNTDGEIGDYKNYNEWYNSKKNSNKVSGQSLMRFTDSIKGNMSDEHQAVLEGILNKAPVEVKNLWKKVQNELVTVNANSKNSFYRHGEGVYFNAKEDSSNENRLRRDRTKLLGKANNTTFYHEYGHHIDALFGRLEKISQREKMGGLWHTYEMKVHRDKSYDLGLSKSLRTEVKETMKRFDVEDISDLVKKLKGTAEKEYSLGYSGVSDIISGLTQANYSMGWGHSRKYWRTKNQDMLSSEAFAHMFQSFTMQGQSHDFMKLVFPDTYNKVIKFIKEESKK